MHHAEGVSLCRVICSELYISKEAIKIWKGGDFMCPYYDKYRDRCSAQSESAWEMTGAMVGHEFRYRMFCSDSSGCKECAVYKIAKEKE